MYFSAKNSSVYCLNSETGELIWEAKFEKDIYDSYPFPGNSPSLCEDKLYVVMSESLYILDAENGEKVFKFSTGAPIWSNPFIYKNKILIVSNDGFLYCLE